MPALPATHRVKSEKGRWLDVGYGSGPDEGPWIPSQMVDAWRKAGAKGEADCARAAALCAELGWSKSYLCVDLSEPLTPELSEAVELSVAKACAKFEKAYKKANAYYFQSDAEGGSKEMRRYGADKLGWGLTSEEAAVRRRVVEKLSVVHKTRWVKAPKASWQIASGRCPLMRSQAAEDAVAFGSRAAELDGLISKANAGAKRLGFVVPAWAKAKRLTEGAFELGAASPSAFEAVKELEEKAAIALFVDRGEHSGFVDRKGATRPDIAEACLFPDVKAAKLFARHHAKYPKVLAVSVRATVLGYEEFIGGPGKCQQLEAVMASRERKEIEATLAEAKVEQLEAELARRRAEAGESAKPAKAKSARL